MPNTVDIVSGDGVNARNLMYAEASRILTCVNACVGVDDRTLAVVEHLGGFKNKMAATIVIAGQRDELLDALEERHDWLASQVQVGQNKFDEPPEPISQFDCELSLCVSDMSTVTAEVESLAILSLDNSDGADR